MCTLILVLQSKIQIKIGKSLNLEDNTKITVVLRDNRHNKEYFLVQE